MISPNQLSESKRRLLERVLRGEMARETWEAPLDPRSPETTVPLAPSQQHVWLHSQMGETRYVYNEPITIHYHGALDQRQFERSFQEFLRRHEIWRTTFPSVDGHVVQVVHPTLEIEIPLSDLKHLPDHERVAEAARIATLDAQRPFDLAVGPLLRGRLFKLRDDDYRFHLTLHHIIFDGVSIYRTMLPELAAIYNAFSKGEPSPLPELALQYADYALWQDRLQQSSSVREQVNYWKEQLAGELAVLELPIDHPRPPIPSYRGAMEKFAISAELSDAVKRRSQTEGVTPYMFLLASFKAMLHRYSGQEDVLVGGTMDGRRRREFHSLVGYFLNTVVLRTQPKSSLTFREYLAAVKEAVTGSLANSDLPFDRLVRELQIHRDSSRHPLFQVLFSIEPPATPVDLPWELTQMDIAAGASKVDLYLEIDEHKDHLIARFIYNTDIFEASTIRRMIGHWTTLLAAAVADPGTRLGDLAMLTSDECQWLDKVSSGPQLAIPHTTIHGLIETQAALTPAAVAVEFEGRTLTYGELDAAASSLALRLREAGVGAETLVGVCVERSAKMVVALLAILKAGGAYVPIDPALPKQRIALIVEDAKAPVILTERALAASLKHTGARLIYHDEPEPALLTSPLAEIAPGNLAYVMYTSGSTGKPKGVEVTHDAVVNLLLSMQQQLGFTAADKLLAVTTISFDIAGLELFLPLISGGRATIAGREDARDPVRLMRLMRDSGCNIMQATPVTWRSLIDIQWPGDWQLKILCGGEALTRDLAQQLLPRCCELWNMYGPTETTIWSTTHRITDRASIVPIGRPIANTEVLILDANLNPVPVGVTGELFIGGAGLGRGYRGQDKLTQERFIAHPVWGRQDGSQRLYRTGDLARWLPEGVVECLGRVDNQVKIRGFRIEVEEIETAISAHPGVRQTAVKAWPFSGSEVFGASLVAYVVAPLRPDLRRFLLDSLPEYMIPSRFVFLDALPLTPNGKVDRNALPAPLQSVERPVGAGNVVPSTGIERRLAAIFESVLGVTHVGTHHNFFDLGGHSLLVAKLLRRIELEFGQRLTMSKIFQSPTIEDLAAVLDAGNGHVSGLRRVNIQSIGARAPLFWIYGSTFFSSLASRLTPAHPFVNITLDPRDEREISSSTLAQVAELLVRKIQAAQPTGPYHLAGWCVAGLIAYEVASQLVAAGEQVKLVAVVGSHNPVFYLSIPAWKVYLSKFRYALTRLGRMRGWLALDYAWERVKRLTGSARDPQGSVKSFEQVVNMAALRYVPKPFDARVVVIGESERPDVPDLKTGWQHVLGDSVEIYQVPGDHVSIFSEAHVDGLSACLNRCLEPAPVSVARAVKSARG